MVGSQGLRVDFELDFEHFGDVRDGRAVSLSNTSLRYLLASKGGNRKPGSGWRARRRASQLLQRECLAHESLRDYWLPSQKQHGEPV